MVSGCPRTVATLSALHSSEGGQIGRKFGANTYRLASLDQMAPSNRPRRVAQYGLSRDTDALVDHYSEPPALPGDLGRNCRRAQGSGRVVA